MISRTAEYALRAVVWMAYAPDATLTTQQIAEVTRVPPGYLAKVLQALGRAGLVRSQRGIRGGYTLTRAPAAITVLEVVNAVDPFRRIRTCPLGLPSHGANLCALHHRIDRSLASVEAALGASTIAELLDERRDSPPLCDAVG